MNAPLSTPRLVASLDIDGTQYAVHDDRHDRDALLLKGALELLRSEGALYLIHNTGRPYPWKCHGEIVERHLNPPIAEADAIIASAGTAVFLGPRKTPSESWRQRILETVSPDTMRDLLDMLEKSDFSIHPESYDSEFKASLIVKPENHAAAALSVTKLLECHFPNKFEISFWNNASIDITPRDINKRTALLHLLRTQGLDSLPVYVAGDSCNDIPVFEVPAFKKIVVGNASPELREKVADLPNLFMAPDHQAVARGVLEGLRHFSVLPPEQKMAVAPATRIPGAP